MLRTVWLLAVVFVAGCSGNNSTSLDGGGDALFGPACPWAASQDVPPSSCRPGDHCTDHGLSFEPYPCRCVSPEQMWICCYPGWPECSTAQTGMPCCPNADELAGGSCKNGCRCDNDHWICPANDLGNTD
jgi:hypothetical protein